MAATAFEFPRGMIRRQPRFQKTQGLLPRLNRVTRRSVEIFPQIVEPLRPLPHHAARFAQRVARGQPSQMAATVAENLPRGPVQPGAQAGHFLAPLRPVAREEFRGGARSRCAQIGDKIGDGEIGLVPHGGNGRNAAGGQRARDDFLVEGPQVLEAPAAARDDEEVDIFLLALKAAMASAISCAAPTPWTRTPRTRMRMPGARR
jgi:hypothetical protein